MNCIVKSASDSSTVMDPMAGFYLQALLTPLVSFLFIGGNLEKLQACELQRPAPMTLNTANLRETLLRISHVHVDVPCLRPPFFPTLSPNSAQPPISTQWKAEQCSVTLARTWTRHLLNTISGISSLITIICNHWSDITNNIDSADMRPRKDYVSDDSVYRCLIDDVNRLCSLHLTETFEVVHLMSILHLVRKCCPDPHSAKWNWVLECSSNECWWNRDSPPAGHFDLCIW